MVKEWELNRNEVINAYLDAFGAHKPTKAEKGMHLVYEASHIIGCTAIAQAAQKKLAEWLEGKMIENDFGFKLIAKSNWQALLKELGVEND